MGGAGREGTKGGREKGSSGSFPFLGGGQGVGRTVKREGGSSGFRKIKREVQKFPRWVDRKIRDVGKSNS